MPRPSFGHVTPENLPLFTDLYELRMMQGYHGQGHNPTATFSLFFRDLPPDRGYMIAAGLEQIAAYLETLTFGDRAVAYLASIGFDPDFLAYLESFEFTGEVRALPEGTAVFPDEPMMEVTAPILEGQLLETLAINQVGFQTLVATKAMRMRDVVTRHGDGQQLVDFGSRRAHGTDAGVKAARAAFVGGFDATSNVAAAEAFGIPAVGTMAHSWIQSFPTERAAFEAFVDEFGEESVLLIDTYDTVRGAEIAASVAADRGVDIRGVRLDSGDLAALSKRVDEVVPDLDQFISSGMDEYAIREFLRRGGIGSGFGPGTALVTSDDAPSLDCVYKLTAVERDGSLAPTMKLSTGKVTYPGPKSVRRLEDDGRFRGDVLGLRDEPDEGVELLRTVVEDGDLVDDLPGLEAIRDRARSQVDALPAGVRRIEEPATYEVAIGDGLAAMTDELSERLAAEHAH